MGFSVRSNKESRVRDVIKQEKIDSDTVYFKDLKEKFESDPVYTTHKKVLNLAAEQDLARSLLLGEEDRDRRVLKSFDKDFKDELIRKKKDLEKRQFEEKEAIIQAQDRARYAVLQEEEKEFKALQTQQYQNLQKVKAVGAKTIKALQENSTAVINEYKIMYQRNNGFDESMIAKVMRGIGILLGKVNPGRTDFKSITKEFAGYKNIFINWNHILAIGVEQLKLSQNLYTFDFVGGHTKDLIEKLIATGLVKKIGEETWGIKRHTAFKPCVV